MKYFTCLYLFTYLKLYSSHTKTIIVDLKNLKSEWNKDCFSTQKLHQVNFHKHSETNKHKTKTGTS